LDILVVRIAILDPLTAMSSFLVTGGAGFIGSHLVRELIACGHRVRVLDNLSTGRRQNLDGLDGRFEFFCGDAANPDQVDEAITGTEGVFHLAAIPSVSMSIREPLQNQQSGEVATLVVLDLARRRGLKRVVYSSSCAVYGNLAAKSANEEARVEPLTFYALSKLTSERYCRIFSSLHPELQTVCLRYFNVFGAGQNPSSSYGGVISIFLRCLRDKAAPTIYGDGRQTRDFIDVSDVVAANIAAMNSRMSFQGDCFNVGTGRSISVLELWKYLADLAQADLQPKFAPVRAGDIQMSCADITKIQSVLHFVPKISWQEGLRGLWSSVCDNE
jgi:UDP-glucose 4-epimerase